MVPPRGGSSPPSGNRLTLLDASALEFAYRDSCLSLAVKSVVLMEGTTVLNISRMLR